MKARLLIPGLLLAAGAVQADAPQVVLTGVILDGRDSVALISFDGRADRSFSVGDRLRDGAVLTAIESDRVYLHRDGKQEILGLKGMDASKLRRADTPPVRALPAHADAFLIPMEGITYISDYHFILSRDKVRDFLGSSEAMKDALWMMQKDGGLFIARIRDGSAYEKAGLRVGDVITRINDTPLNDSNQVMALYAGLDHMQHLDLTIQRMGQEQHLLYDIKP